MKQLAQELGGRARVAMLNVDECPEEAAKFGVRGIPSVLLLKNGALVMEMRASSAKAMLAQVEDSL